MKNNDSEYEINLHKHNMAVWAASRAASASPKCRFKVKEGATILNKGIFKNDFTKDLTVDELPNSAEEFDEKHAEWCKEVRRLSKNRFTYGIAAKLINCYLKVRFVCGGNHDNEKVNFIHPPIDSLLLKNIKKEFGKTYPDLKDIKIAWSMFEEEDYKNVIECIKKIPKISGKPLWKIEEHWPIYQKD